MTPQEAATISEWARVDPAGFMREVLGFDPTPYQARIAESVRDHRKTSVGSCHSAGKSGVAAAIAVWFLIAFPGAIVITTAPTFRQVRGILWDRIRELIQKARIDLGGRLNVTSWRLGPGWFAEGITAPSHDPDKFQGFHSKVGRLLCIVDEAAGLSQTLFDGGVMPITVGEDDRLLLIGNTTSTAGEFARSSKDDSYAYHRVSAFDTPNFTETGITREDIEAETWGAKLEAWRAEHPGESLPRPYLISPVFVADRWKGWGPDSVLFRSRIAAEFVDEGASVLIAPGWWHQAEDRWRSLSPEMRISGKRWIGVDVAMEGRDTSTIWDLFELPSPHKGTPSLLVLSKAREIAINNTQTLVSAVRQVAVEGVPPLAIGVDQTGVGKGVTDILRAEPPIKEGRGGVRRRSKIVPIVAGGRASDPENYPNLRSELGFILRKHFEEVRVAVKPADGGRMPRLFEEATSIQWWPSPKGKHTFVLEPKAEYKKRNNGRSCDDLDGACYAFGAREAVKSGLAWA